MKTFTLVLTLASILPGALRAHAQARKSDPAATSAALETRVSENLDQLRDVSGEGVVLEATRSKFATRAGAELERARATLTLRPDARLFELFFKVALQAKAFDRNRDVEEKVGKLERAQPEKFREALGRLSIVERAQIEELVDGFKSPPSF